MQKTGARSDSPGRAFSRRYLARATTLGEKAVMLNESKAIAEQLLLSAAKEHGLVGFNGFEDRVR